MFLHYIHTCVRGMYVLILPTIYLHIYPDVYIYIYIYINITKIYGDWVVRRAVQQIMRCRIFVERNPLAQCQIQTDRIDKEQRQNVISKIVKMILGSAICENAYFASESFTYWFGREITCSWVIIPGSNFRLNRYKWQYLPSGNFCYRIMLSNLCN